MADDEEYTYQEHDSVRAICRVSTDGHVIPAGAEGAVVSVLDEGHYVVEFPNEPGNPVVDMLGRELEPHILS